MSAPDPRGYTQKNRRAWNEIAAAREKTFPPADFFAGRGSTLDPRAVDAARELFGSLDGLRVIHLQCATGEDTLSWAVLDARAAGVDISDAQIELARAKAAAASLPVDFFAADVYDLPGALPAGWLQDGCDMVFTGGGAIVWLPDLERWARVVTALLRPGGRLILIDEHPLAGCIDLKDGVLHVEDDYFRRARAWEGVGWRHFTGGEDAVETKFEFNWPLGDIVTALARAGLLIERLEEFPGGAEWRFGSAEEQAQSPVARLPGQYLLVARKPAGQ